MVGEDIIRTNAHFWTNWSGNQVNSRRPELAYQAESPAGSKRGQNICCRQIAFADADAIAALLAEGFPLRSKSYWRGVLDCLEARTTPEGFPKFGYMLEAGGSAVGALLLLSASMLTGDVQTVRCNVSSWYVRPPFRSYGSLLALRVGRHLSGTYINIDPDPETWPIIEAQGFRRFGEGTFASVPLLNPRSEKAWVTRIHAEDQTERLLSPEERRILYDHERFGCISLCCELSGSSYPFVFRKRRFRRFSIPCAELIYCRNRDDLARFARPLGRYLAYIGMPWVLVGATGPVPGLLGWYFPNKLPMYFKGPNPPRLGDLAYTEVAVFGL